MESTYPNVRNKVSRGTGILINLRPRINNETIWGLYFSFFCPYFSCCVHIESTKTTSMEDVSTRVLEGEGCLGVGVGKTYIMFGGGGGGLTEGTFITL